LGLSRFDISTTDQSGTAIAFLPNHHVNDSLSITAVVSVAMGFLRALKSQ